MKLQALKTAVVIALSATVLVGCGQPTVDVEPAPQASDPICAEVLMALPKEMAGQERRSTNAQAARAWGDPPIVLRCGVTPPGPTTDRCISVMDPSTGMEMDFIQAELGGEGQGRGTWTFTTYGRVPAVEVTVPVEHAGDDVTALLMSLTNSFGSLVKERECL